MAHGDAKRLIMRLGPVLKGEGPEHHFGWEISTTPQGTIEDNAADARIPQDEAFWEHIDADVLRMERNVVAGLTRIGFIMSPEGHNASGDLVGTGWVREGGRAWRAFLELQDGSERWPTPEISNVTDDDVLAGVSETGRRVVDVYFRVLLPCA